MKPILLFIAALMIFGTLSAQNVKNRGVDVGDVMTLLRVAGYDLYSFDLNDFLKGDYNVELNIKEYEKGKGEINSQDFNAGVNKILFSQFSDEEKREAKELGLTKGMKRGVIYKIDKVNLGVVSSKADSIMMLNVKLGDIGNITQPLKLRPTSNSSGEFESYRYQIRPFVIDSFESGKFIPLVAILSWWYDDAARLFRCCGESMLKADLSANILENVPHYYIIGITIKSNK